MIKSLFSLREFYNRLVFAFGKSRTRFLLCLILAIWGMFVFVPSSTEWLERYFIDLFQKVRMSLTTVNPRFAIVGIDTATLQAIPFRWPWPRSELARVIGGIAAGKPRLIILDILLQHPDAGAGEAGDRALCDLFRQLGNIALVSVIDETMTPDGVQARHFRNAPIFRQSAAFEGFVQTIIDDDQMTRSFAYADERLGVESCALHAARFIFPDLPAPPINPSNVSIGQPAFARRDGSIPIYSAIRLLNEEIPAAVVQDKIVILGVTADILHDFHRTAAGVIPGAELLAVTMDTFIAGRLTHRSEAIPLRFALAIFGGLCGFLTMRSGDRRGLAISLGTLALLLTGGLVSIIWTGIHPPLAPFFLSWLLFSSSMFIAMDTLSALELRLARAEALAAGKIQTSLFPRGNWKSAEGYECRGMCQPCESAGGDYFDILPQKDGSLVFLVVDVSGHGFSASMITVMAKTIVALLNRNGLIEIENLIQTWNAILDGLMKKRMLMTAVVGRIIPSDGSGQLISAAHPPAVIVDSKGVVREMKSPCKPLGLKEASRAVIQNFTLNPGDSLMFYTDGIVEAVDWQEQQYGYERWLEHLSRVIPSFSTNDNLPDLLSDVKSFSSGHPFTDDITLLLLQRKADTAPKVEPSANDA
ncbi:MAG: SpoIIE family protein phosphatase [Candidatus Riflebacteria bacterium]|nr:SpoIIE family protein phosphatase [Candidatus Riflebacteria bacterium]